MAEQLYIPNFVNTLAQADQAAAFAKDQQRQNALAGFMQQNGDALMQGDTNALAQFARLDPMAAMQIQQRQQDQQWRADDRAYGRQQDAIANRRADEQFAAGQARQAKQDGRADEEWRMKLDAYAATKSQQEREAEAAQIELAVQQGLALPDAATWDQFMTQSGQTHLVGKFDQRESIARGYLSIAEQLKGVTPGQGAEYGLNPVYGRDAQGNVVVMQLGKDGRAVATAIPEGITPDLAVKTQEGARGTEVGKATGQAQMGLSGAVAKAQTAIQNLKAIRNDPGLPQITGMVQGRLPPMTQAGTDLNVRIQQAQGQAFLEAFDSLKGSGAITEVEGTKAEQALARLNRAQSTEAYQQALDDLTSVLESGIMRAQERAGLGVTNQEPQQPAPAQPVRRRWTPDGGLQ